MIKINSVTSIKDKQKLDELINSLGELHPKYAILFQIGVDTGLRVSDVLRLRPKDVKSKFTVTEQKTGKRRPVELSKETLKKVRDYAKIMRLKPDDFLIYSRESIKNKPLSRTQTYKAIALSASRNGLECVGTHSMRKTYAQNKYRLYGDVDALRSDFGHRDINTTLGYLVPKDKLNELIAALLE